MSEKNNIDDLLREKLSNLKMDYDPSLWDDFEQQLPVKKRLSPFIMWFSFIGLGLISIGGFFYFMGSASESTVKNSASQPIQNEQPSPQHNSNLTATTNAQAIPHAPSSSEITMLTKANPKSTSHESVKTGSISPSSSNLQNQKPRRSGLASQEANAIQASDNDVNATRASNNNLYKNQASSFSIAENTANNMAPLNGDRTLQTPLHQLLPRSWKLLSPPSNLAQLELNPKTPTARFLTYGIGLYSGWGAHDANSAFTSDLTWEHGIAFDVNYPIKKAWALSSGLHVGQYVEKQHWNLNQIAQRNDIQVTDNSFWDVQQINQTVFDTTYVIGVPFVSSTNQLVADSNYVEQLDSALVTVRDTAQSSFTTTNTYSTFDVPLQVHYRYPIGRWQLALGTGPLVRYTTGATQKVTHERGEGFDSAPIYNRVNSFQLAWFSSAGMNYTVRSGWDIYLRGYWKRFLTPHYQSNGFAANRYDFMGLSFGVVWRY